MSTSNTYSGRALPSTGPSTTEFAPIRDDQPKPCPGWPPQHHWPFVAAGCALFFVGAVLLLVVYGFVDDAEAPPPARNLMSLFGVTLLGLSGVAGLLGLLARAHDRAVIAGVEVGVGEVRALETLHCELQAVSTHLSAIVARLEALVGHRVDTVEQVAERDRAEVEKLAKEHTGFARAVLEQLQRIEPGVEGFRQRLDAVEQQADEQREQVEDLVSVAKVFAVTDAPDAQVRVLHRPNGQTPAPRKGR